MLLLISFYLTLTDVYQYCNYIYMYYTHTASIGFSTFQIGQQLFETLSAERAILIYHTIYWKYHVSIIIEVNVYAFENHLNLCGVISQPYYLYLLCTHTCIKKRASH